MTLAIQSLQRTFCAFKTTNDVTQWWHLVAGVWVMLTQSLQSWKNFLIKLCDLSKSESTPIILWLYTWAQLVKEELCSLVPVLDPASSLLFPVQSRSCGGHGSGAQCLPKGNGAGEVLCALALPVLSACRLTSSRNRNQNVVSRGVWEMSWHSSARKASCHCWGLMWFLPVADCRQHPPSHCPGQGLRERTWLASATQSHVHLFFSTTSCRALQLSHLPLFSSYWRQSPQSFETAAN